MTVGQLPVSLPVALTRADPADMLAGMVSDIWVYRSADRLIKQHGAGALNEADRLVNKALNRRDADRVLLMLRVRFAVVALQAPPSRLLH